MDEIQVDALRGRNVIDNQGRNFGRVEDVAFDPQSWRVRGLIVQVERDVAQSLHLDEARHARLQLTTDRVQTLGDNVILNVDADDIAMLLRRHEGA